MFNIDEKIDRILFDFLGLILPGIISLFVLFIPVYFYDYTLSSNLLRSTDPMVAIFSVIASYLKQINSQNIVLISTIVVLFAYIIGHILKVISKIIYDFLESFFDKTINRLFFYIWVLLCKYSFKLFSTLANILKLKSNTFVQICKQFQIILKPIKNLVNQIFTFHSENYYSDNKELEIQTVRLINKRLNTNFPVVWHTLYKFANVLSVHEKINTLSTSYLAKYNLYRSLSLVFFVNFFYISYFFKSGNYYLPIYILSIKNICLTTNSIFWFTFHIKFKRYWTLCGNETLLSLFYYLNKNEITNGQINPVIEKKDD